MICLDDDLCLGEFNQMSDFFDHLHKTYNFKLYWPIVFFSNGEKSRKEENGLNKTAA